MRLWYFHGWWGWHSGVLVATVPHPGGAYMMPWVEAIVADSDGTIHSAGAIDLTRTKEPME